VEDLVKRHTVALAMLVRNTGASIDAIETQGEILDRLTGGDPDAIQLGVVTDGD
jgi:hypothetical protein